MTNLPKLFRPLVLTLLALAFPLATAYAAPSLLLDPTSQSAVQNATFQVKININTDTNSVLGADAVINYTAADLQVTSVTNGGFFPQFTNPTPTGGKIEMHGYVGTNDSRTGNGTFAVITFTALKKSGSSPLSFTCSGNGTDTDILTTSGQNLLASCTGINTASVTFSSGTTNSPTPTATTAPGTTATPTPTTAPSGGGNTVPTCAKIYTNITSAVGTPQTISITCTGIDPDGYINGAQFTFGDGATQVLKQNVGSPGSITTTHTYTSVGSFGVSCIVQDNNNAWSNSVDACKSTVSINAGPTPTPYRRTPVVLAGATTPTPEIVAIISDTPEPTPAVTETPSPITPAPENSGTGSGNQTWWVIGAIAAIAIAFLLLRRKGPPPPPNTPYFGGPPSQPPSQTPPPSQPTPEPMQTVHLET